MGFMRLSKTKKAVIVGTVAGLVIAGTAVAVAATTGNDEQKTGEPLERAGAAALQHTGSGTITETEIADDGAAYEVEIRLDDGSQVEVHLDDNFNVVGEESDDDAPGDNGSGDDDEAGDDRG